MNVGIFETEHFEGSYPVIKAFDHANHSITIFCYEKTFRQFQFLFGAEMPKYNWIVRDEKTSKIGFIRKIYKESKKRNLSLLYLNTISNNYVFYALLAFFLPKKTRVLLTIHNINSWFQFKFSLSFRRIVRYTGRKFLLGQVRLFNVVAIPMKKQLEKKLGDKDKVFAVPGAFFSPREAAKATFSPGDFIRIVIPGSIDSRRRDYEFAIELLQRFDSLSMPVEITFLGAPYGEYGRGILEKVKSLNLTIARIKIFDGEIVDQPDFDNAMDAAHFIFTPSVLTTTIEDGVMELYGISMSSGNVFDVIKHAKPFIIPKNLVIDDFLAGSTFRYERIEDIIELIESVFAGGVSYPDIADSAVYSSQNYTLDNIINRNTELFNQSID